MFESTTELYDLAYAHKDYAAEAAWVREAVTARAPHARTLLDVACGTGKHLEHLKDWYDCTGLDLLEGFVAIAADRTGVPVHQGDMDGFDLGTTFDAVVCLFSAIGYSKDLDGAIGSMARHLSDGGVLIVEPWFTPEEWSPGHVHVLDHEANGDRLVRMSLSSQEGNRSPVVMHYLVCRHGQPIEHHVEEHVLTLFSLDEYEAAFRTAGLTFEHVQPGPSGRGALIGQRAR